MADEYRRRRLPATTETPPGCARIVGCGRTRSHPWNEKWMWTPLPTPSTAVLGAKEQPASRGSAPQSSRTSLAQQHGAIGCRPARASAGAMRDLELVACRIRRMNTSGATPAMQGARARPLVRWSERDRPGAEHCKREGGCRWAQLGV